MDNTRADTVQKIGEHLVATGALRAGQVEALIEEQRHISSAGVRSRLGEIAVRQGWARADQVTEALAFQARQVIGAADAVSVLRDLGEITAEHAREAAERSAATGESPEEAAAALGLAAPARLRRAAGLANVRAATALRMVAASSFAPFNVMELIVSDQATAAVRADTLCSCSQCWSNVFALALNALPSRYVSDHGSIIEFYRRFSAEYGPLAGERVSAALRQVRANPKASCWSRVSDDMLAGREADTRVEEVVVRVSARHVHLDAATLAALFGEGHALGRFRDLAQPGQFAATETVALVGPKGTIERVRVLGPVRAETQVEISGTDQFALGVEAPVRESGKLEGSPGMRLRGPAGEIAVARGTIRALRHIHMLPADADRLGVANGARVSVRLAGDRATVLEGVLVRVSGTAALEMHIDTDEANAAGVPAESTGQVLMPLMTV